MYIIQARFEWYISRRKNTAGILNYRLMKSIPFTLPELNGGLTEITGRLYEEEEFLVLDVETALLGEFDKEGQVIKIEPAALRDIELDKGVFKDKLRLWPKKRTLLEALPGNYKGEVPLSIWKKHRSDVEEILAWVRLRME